MAHLSSRLQKLNWVIYGNESELKQPLDERAFDGYSLNREGIHINLLEFIAIFINIWMTLKLIAQRFPDYRQKTFIAQYLADNTSALCWLQYAGRSNRLPVRNLARLLTAFLVYRSDFPIQVLGEFIPGLKNIVADALSRFSKHPSWGSLIEDPSLHLRNVQAYRLPPQLLSTLWSIASCPKIADTSEQVITRLWRLELQTLPNGWQEWDSTTSLC